MACINQINSNTIYTLFQSHLNWTFYFTLGVFLNGNGEKFGIEELRVEITAPFNEQIGGNYVAV